MTLWDVNLLVYAFRSDSPNHIEARDIIQRERIEGQRILVSAVIASSFIRIVTNPKIFLEPSDLAEAWRFIEYLELEAHAHFATIDSETYALFKHFCLVTNAKGNLVPDAFIAATALRYNAKFVTADRGFARFPGLQTEIVALS